MNRFISALTVLLFALPVAAWAEGESVTIEKKSIEVAAENTEQPNQEAAIADTAIAANGKEKCSVTHSDRRQHRGISNLKTEFVPKGQWMFGGSVSYSTHSNKDFTFLIVEDIQSNGYQFKISPILGYAYSRNSLVGDFELITIRLYILHN
jgi:hypothetical protein